MKNKILFLSLALILVATLISSASATQTFQKGEIIDLKIPCFNNGTYCSDASECSITVNYPNGSVMINNEAMTYNTAYHNYTITDSNVIGTYFCSVVCEDSGYTGYSRFSFDITTTGFAGGWANLTWLIPVILIFIALVSICFIVGFKIEENTIKIVMFLLGFFFILMGLVIVAKSVVVESTIASSFLNTAYIVMTWVIILTVAYIVIRLIFTILMNIKAKKEKEKQGTWEKW